MDTDEFIETRVNGRIKREADTVLAEMGLTVSDAIRLLLAKVARERALPFDPLVPNATTVAAMREAEAGRLPSVKSIDELKAALLADD
jgi:DNA-damage-inducible protein J